MPKTTDGRPAEILPGTRLTPDEIEFATAMERYMRLANRPFPTWHEVLAVVTALGYRKLPTAKPREPRPPSE